MMWSPVCALVLLLLVVGYYTTVMGQRLEDGRMVAKLQLASSVAFAVMLDVYWTGGTQITLINILASAGLLFGM